MGGTRAPLTSNCAAHPQLWQEQAPSSPVSCRAGPRCFPHRCVHQRGSAAPAAAAGSESSRAARTPPVQARLLVCLCEPEKTKASRYNPLPGGGGRIEPSPSRHARITFLLHPVLPPLSPSPFLILVQVWQPVCFFSSIETAITASPSQPPAPQTQPGPSQTQEKHGDMERNVQESQGLPSTSAPSRYCSGPLAMKAAGLRATARGALRAAPFFSQNCLTCCFLPAFLVFSSRTSPSKRRGGSEIHMRPAAGSEGLPAKQTTAS